MLGSASNWIGIAGIVCLITGVPATLRAQAEDPGNSQPDAGWEISVRGGWGNLQHASDLVPATREFVPFGTSFTFPNAWPASDWGFGWEALVRRDFGSGLGLALGAGDQRQSLDTPLEDADPKYLDIFVVFVESTYRIPIADRHFRPIVGARLGRFELDGRIAARSTRLDMALEAAGFEVGWIAGGIWDVSRAVDLELTLIYSLYLPGESEVTATSPPNFEPVDGPAGDATGIGARAGLVFRVP